MMKSHHLYICLILMACGFNLGCRSRTRVEVIDLNKVLDIYDKCVKSKEDPSRTESDKLTASTQDNSKDTEAFLKLFAAELNKAKLIQSPLGVEMQSSGMIRGFIDRDKNGVRHGSPTKEPEVFTIEYDSEKNRIIATQKVGGQQYRRDHYYGPTYARYYFYHRMHSGMWYRQNSYYGPMRPRPNYGAMRMSSSNYHTAAVSRAQSIARSSSRSSRSSARGFGRSGSFSGGK